MSTPMGPVEVSQARYAHNRLGLNTRVCQAWGVDLDRITNNVTICQIMERSAFLSIELLRNALNELWGESIAAGRIMRQRAAF